MPYFYVLKNKDNKFWGYECQLGEDPCDEKTMWWDTKKEAEDLCKTLNRKRKVPIWQVKRYDNSKPNCVQIRIILKHQLRDKPILIEEVLDGSRELKFPPQFYSYPREGYGCIPLKNKEHYIQMFLEQALKDGQTRIDEIQEDMKQIKEFIEERKNGKV